LVQKLSMIIDNSTIDVSNSYCWISVLVFYCIGGTQSGGLLKLRDCIVIVMCIHMYLTHTVGLFIMFSCARVSVDNTIVVKLTIDAHTAKTHYVPVELFLTKTCGRDSIGKNVQ